MIASTRLALALCAIAVFAPGVCAHGRGGYSAGYYYYPSYYYAPPPIAYYVPIAEYFGVPDLVCPAPQQIFAQPTAAPPRSTNEPPQSPAKPQPPKVSESRSLYSAYSGRRHTSYKIGASHCRVGYWNVTNRNVSLAVEGQSYFLAPGRGMTLTVPRQFTWQMDRGKLNRESVPSDRPTMEIVIRK